MPWLPAGHLENPPSNLAILKYQRQPYNEGPFRWEFAPRMLRNRSGPTHQLVALNKLPLPLYRLHEVLWKDFLGLLFSIITYLIKFVTEINILSFSPHIINPTFPSIIMDMESTKAKPRPYPVVIPCWTFFKKER